MPKKSQAELGRRFLELHQGPKILVLPNAWDAASARIFEEAGFAAIGTSSACVAFALGYPDGQKVSREEMLGAVRTIVGAVEVPVTADLEAGYATTPEQVAGTAQAAIAAGAVGMNLEDGLQDKRDFLADINLQKEIIRAVIETAAASGVPFVLNARTDIFLHAIGPAETRLARTIERLNAYREAGAQCLFAPGVTDSETIGHLTKGVAGPLNILAMGPTPPVAELERLGVARVSLGSGPIRATLGFLGRMARQLRDEGAFTMMTAGAPAHDDMNRLFESRRGQS